MKIEVKINKELKEPYFIIYTNDLSEEINNIVSNLSEQENDVITVKEDEKIVVLNSKEIYMLRIEGSCLVIYSNKNRYISNKRLYEFEELLSKDFMRISKSSIINLSKISYVQPAFNGMMKVILKNGTKDYISRKYLPNLKKYLGL